MKKENLTPIIRAILIEYHKYLESFNDPTIFNVPIEWIDDFLINVINKDEIR
jgi:hypothetical protein